jgi:hypothetical protein
MSEQEGGDSKFITGLLIGICIGLALGGGGVGMLMMRTERARLAEHEMMAAVAAEAADRQKRAEMLLREAQEKVKAFEARQPKEADMKP